LKRLNGYVGRDNAPALASSQPITIFAQKYPITQEVITDIRPGSIKLWLKRYLPILVVPERSKLMDAMSLG
jgi:hypothetical protein